MTAQLSIPAVHFGISYNIPPLLIAEYPSTHAVTSLCSECVVSCSVSFSQKGC